jgi:hypothetical protein
MKLAALQAKFQDALLGRDAEREILAAIAPSPRLEPTARFEVYAQAYRLRLAGFLAEDFKVLNNALGDAGFHTLTHAYIAATPSRHRNARWYARDLPDFMQATAPWNESRSLVDIARLERALADAFDATDAPAASRAALAGLAPDAWPQIRLIFQESATMLSLARGITAAFTAAAAEAPCPEPDETQDECVLVWRNRDAHLAYRELTAAESLALGEAIAGKSFADICALLQFHDAEANEETIAARAGAFLAQWFTDGLISKIANLPIAAQ